MTCLLFPSTTLVYANPQGGQVTSGNASITTTPGTVTVNQFSSRAVINWNSFSINSGELTRFIQPNTSSAVLNRVLGGNPSQIYGTLTSNGAVYLINPNGILVGPGGVIDTGSGFFGSTLNVSDSAFMNGGDLTFSGSSLSNVVNYGTISSLQGDVVLLGYTVENHGTIDALQGDALLGAGSTVLLKAVGMDRIYIQSALTSNLLNQTGVDNQGVINAASAQLKAAGGNVYALAINNDGIINATGVNNSGGRIVLTSENGNVRVGGTLTAKLENGDGGEILVGGEYQGSDPEQVENAQNVLVTEDAFIDVSADSGTGNGGRVIVWADDSTYYYGFIDARAGLLGGNGGFAEVSGKQYLDYRGLADLRAPQGLFGQLLLDPTNVTIQDGVGQQNVSGPAGNVIGSNGTSPTIINATTINTQLGLGDLTIQTNGAGAEPGNIIVNSAITWNSNNTLNFDAHNSIILNASITANGPTAILNLYDFVGNSRGAGDVTSVNGATLTANQVNVATGGNVNLAGALVTSLFRVNNLGVGGSLTATNTNNAIGSLSFASGTLMTGNVNIFDGAGGLNLIFSSLNTNGSVTLRTVGNFTLANGHSITAGGNVTFEANGGTFTAGNPFTLTAPRYIVYANAFTQGGFPALGTTSNANFGSDPIGAGNVFYMPSVPTTTTTTTTTFGGDGTQVRTQDNETQANLKLAQASENSAWMNWSDDESNRVKGGSKKSSELPVVLKPACLKKECGADKFSEGEGEAGRNLYQGLFLARD